MAEDRMKRLESGYLREEAGTLRIMVKIFCRGQGHENRDEEGICPECREFLEYALKRLACCPYGERKPVCGKCRIHCYRPQVRPTSVAVMRYAGPRLALGHPVLSLKHAWRSITVEAPEKPRNPAAEKGRQATWPPKEVR